MICHACDRIQSPIHVDRRSYSSCTAVVVCIRYVPKLAFILHASMPKESIPFEYCLSAPAAPELCMRTNGQTLFLILSRQKIVFESSCICAVKQYVNLRSKIQTAHELSGFDRLSCRGRSADILAHALLFSHSTVTHLSPMSQIQLVAAHIRHLNIGKRLFRCPVLPQTLLLRARCLSKLASSLARYPHRLMSCA